MGALRTARAASGETRRARGRPSGAARPRRRAAARAAGVLVRELQCTEGVESATAVMGVLWVVRCAAEAMSFDGVHADTLVMLVES